jgi:sugar phosphate isomerase/epimerase/type 1 glutamine amidotransferase
MLKSILHLMAVAVAAVCVTSVLGAEDTGPAPKPPVRANKIRVLIVTGGHDFERKEFFEMFDSCPDITWKEVQQPDAQKWFAPDKADSYDAMVWYDFNAKLTEESRKDLEALLKKGKPLVVLHHAAGDYQDWPEAIKIIGAKYNLKPGPSDPKPTFKHDVKVPVKIGDAQHPITRFMKDFEIEDETYKNMEFLPGTHPLLTTDEATSDKVLAFTHTYGKSPVVYVQLGHDGKAYANPSYRRLLMQSIRYVMGRLPDPSATGFVPLLNGKDFKDWTIMGDAKGFWFTDGILRSESNKGGLWMRTNRKYGDFILRVEWRVGKDGNSGVFVRSAAEGYPWVTGSEIQISNEPRDIAHCTGSLYGTAAVDPRPDESADVWHEFEIRCQGYHYQVFADNIPIVDVDARTIPELKAKPLEGYIGLQDSHNRQAYVEYRNVLIKELPAMSKDTEPAWRVGVQAWTFNQSTFLESVDKARSIGLKYIEAFPGQKLGAAFGDAKFHHDMPADLRLTAKTKLAEAGVKLVNYGVVPLGKDEASARKVFDFAKEMGIETIVSEPEPGTFPILDKLTQEYGINVAIHNHPKPSHYWNPDTVLDAVKGTNPRIGACADTGHWVRSGLDPLECIKKLNGRIISLHLKDLDQKALNATDVHWGEGVANVAGILAELKRQNFKGVFSVEYETNWGKNDRDVAACAKNFEKMAKELGM